MTNDEYDDEGILAAVIRELRALPPEMELTHEEAMHFARRLPKRPPNPTSAEIIRQFRGPLPEDDPYFVSQLDPATGEWRRVPAIDTLPPGRPIVLPEGWSSAEIIRELRGPFPEDDPDFAP